MLYDNIVDLCRERHITISRLEKECKLGNATVRGWAVSTPKLDRIKKVADFFGVTIDELISDSK